MNDIEGQDDGSEQGCCEGARVPDYQDINIEDEVHNKANVIRGIWNLQNGSFFGKIPNGL